jgi:predicted phosphodiesterase
MRFAVISDVHGNLEALLAVLQDIENSRVEAIYSLGDHIGYGPDPEAVVQEIIKGRIPAVLGNHELAAIDPDHLNWFNPVARKSLVQSIAMLSQSSLAAIGRLEKSMILADCLFVHGFPPDSVDTYRFQVGPDERQRIMAAMPAPVCFIGHTHELVLLTSDGASVTSHRIEQGTISLTKSRRYIINVGSVGQPRDGNNNAKYVIWDTDLFTIEVKYVPYDISTVAKKIIDAGLPRSHADRLW